MKMQIVLMKSWLTTAQRLYNVEAKSLIGHFKRKLDVLEEYVTDEKNARMTERKETLQEACKLVGASEATDGTKKCSIPGAPEGYVVHYF